MCCVKRIKSKSIKMFGGAILPMVLYVAETSGVICVLRKKVNMLEMKRLRSLVRVTRMN